jgi:hypothetical protein
VIVLGARLRGRIVCLPPAELPHGGQIAADLRSPLAAILGQEAQEAANAFDVRRIEYLSALPVPGQKTRAFQVLQVKGQRRRLRIQAPRDLARRKTARPLDHQEPEDRKTGLLCKGREGGYGV